MINKLKAEGVQVSKPDRDFLDVGTRARKREVEIEKLVRWAFQDELSKRYTSSSSNWGRVIEYGTLGIEPEGSHTPQRYDHGEPHPDAEKIEQAIFALPNGAIQWDIEGQKIMGDLIALADPRSKRKREEQRKRKTVVGWWQAGKFVNRDVTPVRDLILVQSLRTSALVAMHGKLGNRPDWHSEAPTPECLIGNKGRPVLVGECWGKRSYSPGSYCPLQWSPSPISIAEARADYLAWWRGLVLVAAALKGLQDYVPTMPEAPEMPWLVPERVIVVHRGLKSLARPLPLKPKRDHAGPPASRRRYPGRVISKG